MRFILKWTALLFPDSAIKIKKKQLNKAIKIHEQKDVMRIVNLIHDFYKKVCTCTFPHCQLWLRRNTLFIVNSMRGIIVRHYWKETDTISCYSTVFSLSIKIQKAIKLSAAVQRRHTDITTGQMVLSSSERHINSFTVIIVN